MATAYLYPVSPDESTLGSMAPVGATYMYECVDDAYDSPNDNTDYLRNNTISSKTVIFNLTDWAAGQCTINSVTVTIRFRCNAAGATCNVTPKLRIGTTNYAGDISSDVNNSKYVDYSYVFDENPATSEAWDYTDLDDLMAGVTKTGKIRITQIYVKVDYTPQTTIDVTKGTFTVTGKATGLTAQRKIDAATQSASLTGINVGLTAQRLISATLAEIDVVPVDVGLEYTPNQHVDYPMAVDLAEYLLTCFDVNLTAQRVIEVETSAISIISLDVDLICDRQLPVYYSPIVGSGWAAVELEKKVDEIIKEDEEILMVIMALVENRAVA